MTWSGWPSVLLAYTLTQALEKQRHAATVWFFNKIAAGPVSKRANRIVRQCFPEVSAKSPSRGSLRHRRVAEAHDL